MDRRRCPALRDSSRLVAGLYRKNRPIHEADHLDAVSGARWWEPPRKPFNTGFDDACNQFRLFRLHRCHDCLRVRNEQHPVQELERGFCRDALLARFQNQQLNSNLEFIRFRNYVVEDLLALAVSEFENLSLLVAHESVSTLKVFRVQSAKNLLIFNPAPDHLCAFFGDRAIETDSKTSPADTFVGDGIYVSGELLDLLKGMWSRTPAFALRELIEVGEYDPFAVRSYFPSSIRCRMG